MKPIRPGGPAQSRWGFVTCTSLPPFGWHSPLCTTFDVWAWPISNPESQGSLLIRKGGMSGTGKENMKKKHLLVTRWAAYASWLSTTMWSPFITTIGDPSNISRRKEWSKTPSGQPDSDVWDSRQELTSQLQVPWLTWLMTGCELNTLPTAGPSQLKVDGKSTITKQNKHLKRSWPIWLIPVLTKLFSKALQQHRPLNGTLPWKPTGLCIKIG